MISTSEAQRQYQEGYRNGDARRNGRAPSPVSPALVSSFWFQRGDGDGFVGNPFLSFVFADGAAGDADEARAYEQGYNGQPLTLPYLQGWYDSGKADIAAGRAPTWLIRSEFIGRNSSPVVVGPPPYRGPGPVIVNPPPPGPYGVPAPTYPPPVFGPYGGYPPPFPRRWRRRRTGLVIRGPWGEIDLAELAAALGNPQPVPPSDLLY